MNIIIKKYLDKITIDDMTKFLKKHDINLSQEENNYLFNYIKNNLETILYGNPFKDIKPNISESNLLKLSELYNYYKKKYYNYL